MIDDGLRIVVNAAYSCVVQSTSLGRDFDHYLSLVHFIYPIDAMQYAIKHLGAEAVRSRQETIVMPISYLLTEHCLVTWVDL